ncbi:hypothetical protein MBT84_38090 [Streptomyces sp. MBT84]|nr:hypothetical protein [Streptomyces sp. MBT84]
MRRGTTSSVRYRRAMMLLAFAGGNREPLIVQLVQADKGSAATALWNTSQRQGGQLTGSS